MRAAALALLLSLGCASQIAQQRANELGGYVEPLMGRSKREVVDVLGPPSSRESVGGYEVWRWRQTVGYRSAAYAPASYAAYGRSHVQYDEVICYFDRGRLSRYNVNSVR